MKKLILLFILAYQSSLFAGDIIPLPELLFVGNGSGQCTYTSIQDAIDDAPPNSEIRVTTEIEPYHENLNISKSLVLKGGYSSCGLAQLDSRIDENKSVIDAQFSGTVVTAISDNISIDISGFWFMHGLGGGFSPAGGMVLSGNNSEFNLENVFVSNNEGTHGGGIFIANEAVLNLRNSKIFVNDSISGGGVYCAVSSDVNLLEGSEINYNTADDGGGIYADNCDVYLKSGTPINGSYEDSGISVNAARDSGGGIYLDTSNLFSGVVVSNPGLGPTLLSENQSNIGAGLDGDGGAIYAVNSELFLGFTRFNNNVAHNGNGGALYVVGSAVESYDSEICLHLSNKCVWFEGNKTQKSNEINHYYGGAIFASNSSIGSNGGPFNGYFIENKSDDGSAMSLAEGGRAFIQNSYFVNNGNSGLGSTNDESVLLVNGVGAEAKLEFSTFAHNNSDKVIKVVSHGKALLMNSIVNEDSIFNQVLELIDGEFTANCNVLHESGSLQGEGTDIVVDTNPGFLNSEAGNYQLSPNSVAIDLCLEPKNNMNLENDRDGDTRGSDFINPNNGDGDFDAGADEYNDVIFNSGFDPGSNSAGG